MVTVLRHALCVKLETGTGHQTKQTIMAVHAARDVYGLLAAALRVLPEPIVLCDYDHILFANDAAQRLLGGSRAAQVEGASCEGFFDPEYAEVNAEQRRYVLHDLIEFVDFPVEVHTLDGGCCT